MLPHPPDDQEENYAALNPKLQSCNFDFFKCKDILEQLICQTPVFNFTLQPQEKI
jgi:hypothetical protein